MKKQKRQPNALIKLRDDFYVNPMQIDCIIRTEKHPGDNTTLSEPKYCVYLRNSYYKWALVSIEQFENNIKPFI